MLKKIALAATTATLVLALGTPAHADISVAPTAHFGGVTRDSDMSGTVTFEQKANGKYEVHANFTELNEGKYTVFVQATFVGGANSGTPQFKVCDMKGKDKSDFATTRTGKVPQSKCSNDKLNLWGATPVSVRIYANGGDFVEALVVS